MVVCLATASRVLPGGRVLLVMLWAAGGGWWWWLWLDCLVVVVSAGGPDDGPWVCGGGWACLVVVMVCPCGWCWVWYHWACGLRSGHSPLRVARARWSGSPSGRWRRVLTHPSGRRLLRSQQGLGSLPGAHTSLRTAAVS